MPARTSRFSALIRTATVAMAVLAIGACTKPSAQGENGAAPASQARSTPSTDCEAGNGGITLPDGYCASVFADNLGHARHLTVAPNGDVYVNTWFTERHKTMPPSGGYVVALRDADKDGRAELVERFGTAYTPGMHGGGTGIAIHRGALYVEVDDRIVRYRLGGGLVPDPATEVVLSGLPKVGDHQAHPFVIAPDETMFVNSGSKTNACQLKNRALESPGQKPCAELSEHAGIWRYRANATNQVFSARDRYATGLRNTLAFAIEPGDGELYAVVHGRDQLSENWPKKFTAAQNTELPAEVLVRVAEGKDYGWPMCYFDEAQSAYFLAPEYGGDGKSSRGCENKERPMLSFPAHWAPEAMVFAAADGPFPDYRNGAFVSFHGSWNREPAQSGFLVAFVPFAEGRPSGKYQEFATGFAGPAMPAAPDQAVYRPVGVALGADGSLYVSDDVKGRIWRVVRSAK